MSQIEFKRGEFQQFRATTNVHVGKTGYELKKDDVIEFDGQTVRIGNETLQVSNLKAAIKVDWLVPVADTTTQYHPRPSGIRVRPAQDASGASEDKLDLQTVNDEERVVGELETANLGQRDGKTVNIATATELPVEVGEPVAPAMEVQGAVNETGDGSVVAKISSATNQKTILDGSTNVSQEINRLDNPQGVSKLPVEHVRQTRKAAAEKAATVPAQQSQVKIIIWDPRQSSKQRLLRAVKEFGDNKDALTQIYRIENEVVRDGIKRFWALRKARLEGKK